MEIQGVVAHTVCTKLGGHRAVARLKSLALVLAPASGSGGLKLHVNAPADRCGDLDERVH